jgi:hypothetical protein
MILVVMTIIDAIGEVSEEKLSYTGPNIILVSGIINAITFVSTDYHGKKKLEDTCTKGVIGSRKPKKDRKYNGQKKKD